MSLNTPQYGSPDSLLSEALALGPENLDSSPRAYNFLVSAVSFNFPVFVSLPGEQGRWLLLSSFFRETT